MMIKKISGFVLLSSALSISAAIAGETTNIENDVFFVASQEDITVEEKEKEKTSDTVPVIDANSDKEERREKRLERRNATTPSDVRATLEVPKSEKDKLLNKKWEHVLPFYAQNVIDLGFDLPLPFTFSLIPNYNKTKILVSHLQLEVPPVQDFIDSIDLNEINFEEMEVESSSLQARFAAWVLPFMQVGVHVGRFSGSSEMYVTIPTTIFNHLGSYDCQSLASDSNRPAQIEIGEQKVAACEKAQSKIPDEISLDPFEPDYKGWNYGLTTNFVIGIGNYFALLPLSYTWAKTDDGRTESGTFLVSPRIGHSYHVKNLGLITGYIGLSYMSMHGTTKQSNPEINGTENSSGEEVTLTGLSYAVRQENSDAMAGLIGANWAVSEHYSLLAEVDYGKGRTSVMMMVNYNF